MKILLLTSHLDMGGIPMYTVGLARYLRKNGHEVIVVSGGGALESVLSAEGVRSVVMDIRGKAEFGPKVWKAILPLKRIVNEERVDVVHSQTRITHVIGAVIDRLTGVPQVTTCHGFFKHKRLSRRLFPCWGRRTVAISSSVAEHLVKDFGLPRGRVDLVHNGIETGKYTTGAIQEKDLALKAEIGLDMERPVIGTVGRLSPVKGHRHLIDAFDILVRGGADVQLLLVGQGPDEKELKARIAGLSSAPRIFVDPGNKRIERYLGIIEIYCMPSIDEGFGLSLVEAMAAGRPCVASDIGGLSEIITDGADGLLVPPGDPQSLAKAVRRLLDDADLRTRLALAGRQRALRDFNIEKSVAGTIEVYEKAISE